MVWGNKDFLVLIPVYKSFSPETHYSLFLNYINYGPQKIGLIHEMRGAIHDARDRLIHKALRSNVEWFIFVDDDMILPCGSSHIFNKQFRAQIDERRAGFNAFNRIMSHESDKLIVGGLYCSRTGSNKIQCSSAYYSEEENKKLFNLEYSGLKAEEWTGTGFMRIHRKVFAEMDKAIKEGKFPECKPFTEKLWTGYFQPSRVGVGEDVSFCRRAKEIGIQSYVDTDLILLHTGSINYGPRSSNFKPVDSQQLPILL